MRSGRVGRRLLLAGVLAWAVTGCGITWTPGVPSPTRSASSSTDPSPSATPTGAPTLSAPSWPGADAVVAENDNPGQPGWLTGPVTVTAYRLGHYGGVGSRTIWTSDPVTDVTQPKPQYLATTRTWTAANWTSSGRTRSTGTSASSPLRSAVSA
ncbi:MAG: hypothetical protein U0Q08_01590 [Dermatophilaceae bacterium]